VWNSKWFISIPLFPLYIFFLTCNLLIDYSIVKLYVPILTQYRCLLEGKEWFSFSLCWFSVQLSLLPESSFFRSLRFVYCVPFSQSHVLFTLHFSFLLLSGLSPPHIVSCEVSFLETIYVLEQGVNLFYSPSTERISFCLWISVVEKCLMCPVFQFQTPAFYTLMINFRETQTEY
jgi:hypothetical protein